MTDTQQQTPTVYNSILLSVDDITERDDNPNRMDDLRYEDLCALVRRYGFVAPVLVRRSPNGPRPYEMVNGHHRLKAAKDCGLVKIPAVVVDLADDDARALQVGLNRVHGELDVLSTAKVLVDLMEVDGWEMGLVSDLGFTETEIAQMASLVGTLAADKPLFDEPTEIPEEGPPDQAPRWVLEFEFATKAELTAVRKALKSIHSDPAQALRAVLELA